MTILIKYCPPWTSSVFVTFPLYTLFTRMFSAYFTLYDTSLPYPPVHEQLESLEPTAVFAELQVLSNDQKGHGLMSWCVNECIGEESINECNESMEDWRNGDQMCQGTGAWFCLLLLLADGDGELLTWFKEVQGVPMLFNKCNRQKRKLWIV